jgi:predicted nucleic acid-binding protein
MCIIIDSCVLPKVFKKSDTQHEKYREVCEWIISGEGTLVFGGTKFTNEIYNDHKWFIKALGLLLSHKKAKRIENKKVDDRQEIVERLETNPDFDDPHLVALIGVTGCRLICTGDDRAGKFLRKKALYPKGAKVPSIYKNSTNADLLVKANIGKCCEKPPTKLNKKNQALLQLPI